MDYCNSPPNAVTLTKCHYTIAKVIIDIFLHESIVNYLLCSDINKWYYMAVEAGKIDLKEKKDTIIFSLVNGLVQYLNWYY